MTLEDKLDCVARLDIVFKDNPQTNIKSIFDLVKANSSCYNCPENGGECTVEKVNQFYLEMRASRGILPVKEVQPSYDLFGWLKDKGEGEEPLYIGGIVSDED